MRREVLEGIASRFSMRTQALHSQYHQGTTLTNFHHLTNNLLSMIMLGPGVCGEECWDEVRREYGHSYHALKRYLRLLERHPEFGAAEFSSQEGMYPDIPKLVTPELRSQGHISVASVYVQEASRRLSKAKS